MRAAPATGTADVVDGVLSGRVREIGRALSAVERAGGAPEILRDLYPKTGRARIVGITGPPGAGKSTLVQRLAQAYRRRGSTIAVVAVDPSSPFTGGAILGDRIRMSEIFTDPGVFIRSMATRGALGGLARATGDAVDVLDAAGFDLVLVETVGVGQDEVDIVKTADTTVVVLVPGLGDDIQAIKAGILEIADVFLVNKADREGADRTAAEIATMLDFTPNRPWRPPIVRTVAPRGEGVEETVAAIDSHGEFLASTGEGRRRRTRRVRARLLHLLEERFRRAVEAGAGRPEGLEEAVADVLERREDPYAAAGRLYGRLMRE
ncbi:MAG TPA: methylmalonyl Co-A mutase-associated GTPase MeaB [Thermoanaerobaculia bacterium]|nr:methylmalonyl Co-A mutase-associated GTPase MeaB [Thermoanaerobaculia bacterium]